MIQTVTADRPRAELLGPDDVFAILDARMIERLTADRTRSVRPPAPERDRGRG